MEKQEGANNDERVKENSERGKSPSGRLEVEEGETNEGKKVEVVGMEWLKLVEQRSELSFDEIMGVLGKNKARKERRKVKQSDGKRSKRVNETVVEMEEKEYEPGPSDMMGMKVKLIREEVVSRREVVVRKGAEVGRALLRGRVRVGMAEDRCRAEVARVVGVGERVGEVLGEEVARMVVVEKSGEDSKVAEVEEVLVHTG